ncbi:hypothetical protein ACFXGT_38860 [Streptomyces sp. NPDC059352]|uniref:hypothetical protein n=1 Tax=Streptomyces sp. NPDC059352 TaxID=3346810 RepID=UPI0036B4DFFD
MIEYDLPELRRAVEHRAVLAVTGDESVRDQAGTVSYMPCWGNVAGGGTAAAAVDERKPPGSAAAPVVSAVAVMNPLRPRGVCGEGMA